MRAAMDMETQYVFHLLSLGHRCACERQIEWERRATKDLGMVHLLGILRIRLGSLPTNMRVNNNLDTC